MALEINYDASSIMEKPYPEIRKLGAIHPNGETSPFVFCGRLYRLELEDPSRGVDPHAEIHALIRDRETGEVLSRFGEGCYYHSLYVEDDTVYVPATKRRSADILWGDTIVLYESKDLKSWSYRELFTNPGWNYFNTSLTKGPDGYVLLMESNCPKEHTGGKGFTMFFATSPDLVNWTLMDYDKGYPKDRYSGGPWMRYSNGYYYVILVTALPLRRFTNYIFRTKDFDTWEVGKYNPILMPDNGDRLISPYAAGFTPEQIKEIRTGFNINCSDVDMCEYGGKTLITYAAGNQLGFYYTAEAEYNGTVDEFLAAYFD